MTWAEANYDLQKDIEWTLSNIRRLRRKIRARRFGPEFTDLLVMLRAAGEFTRSAGLRQRCAAMMVEAEQALANRYA